MRRNRLEFRWSRLLPLASLLLACSCSNELEQDLAPGERVRPLYDSETGVVPLPNSAAVDADGTLPRRDGAGRGSAQGEFYRWFAELRGWPTSTPISVPFDGRLDPESLDAESVRLGEVVEGAWRAMEVSVAYREGNCGEGCVSQIVLTPAESLSANTSYAVALSRDVTDADGAPIGEPVAYFYAASPEPLVDEEGEPTLSLFEDDAQTAQQLEELRRRTAPYLKAAETVSPVDEFALVYGWETASVRTVEFDADTGRLPLPNDLALDGDGTFPAAALAFCGDAARDSCAQGDFDSYLDGLHGWPTATPIVVPFTSVDGAPALEMATIDEETVQLWRLDGDAPVRLERTVEASDDGLRVVPAEPLVAAGRYALFATRDLAFVLADETAPLLPDPVTVLAVQGNEVADFAPQTEACGEVCGAGAACVSGACVATASDCGQCGDGEVCTDGGCVAQTCAASLVAEVPDCDAESIEEARLALAPAVELIEEAADVDYDDLAALTVWTSVTDTFLDFDPQTGRVPFPNELLRAGCDAERPICALFDPEAMDPAGLLLNSLSRRQGFSTFATNFVPTSGPELDAETLQAGTSVRFAQVPGAIPQLLDPAAFSVGYEAGLVTVDFAEPLLTETLSVGVITDEALGSNGHAVQPSATFALIRNAHPLIDANGVSQVDVLDDATAQQLEPARASLEQLFDNAFVLGLTREEIRSAWPFTTGRTTRPTQELRARTHFLLDGEGGPAATTTGAPVVLTGDMFEDPNFPGVQVAFDSVASIHTNLEFETVNWVGPAGLVEDAETTRDPVGVTVYVPEDNDPAAGSGCEPPYDVALVQHGLGGWRNQSSFALANPLAESCVAVVAIDLPLHGGRTPGEASLHPMMKPAGSGASFVSADLVGTLAHYQQSVIDLSIVTRLIREGGLDAAVGQGFSDETSRIGYVGVSLGGQIGTAFLAVEPTPTAGVLNVAGANLALYLTESEAFAPLLDALGVMPGTAEFVQTVHFIQWASDHIDPFTFAAGVTRAPLDSLSYDGTDFSESPGSVKEVLVQMVAGDPATPNVATVLLATTFGVTLEATTFMGTEHSFLDFTDPAAADLAQASCARQQVVAFLASAFEGNASLPASLDAQTCVDNF